MRDIERRLIAARPVSGGRDLPLSDRAKRELAELVLAVPSAQPQAGQRRLRHRPRRAYLLAAVIAAAAVMIVPAAVVSPQHAWAATLPPLQTSPVGEAAATLLNEIADMTALDDESHGPVTTSIAMQSWTLETESDGNAIDSTVAFKDYSITRYSDGSRSVVVTAGRVIDADGNPVHGKNIPEIGDVLWQESYGPGEYSYVFPGDFPEDWDQVAVYLAGAFGSATRLDATLTVQAVTALLTEQTLNGPQRTALLRYLATVPELNVAGKVTDRLGRIGIAFTAAGANPDYIDYIVVSPSNGDVLAVETDYVGHERSDIRSPSAISYYAWS